MARKAVENLDFGLARWEGRIGMWIMAEKPLDPKKTERTQSVRGKNRLG
jgi:hypothetical protein